METNQEKTDIIINRLTKSVNETIRLKREFNNTIIGVVGVCFGVLVAMKERDQSPRTNWIYFAGLICCALSLTFLVIGARAPIAAHKNLQAELIEELISCSKKKQAPKSIKRYRICRILGYAFFFATIALFCVYSFLFMRLNM